MYFNESGLKYDFIVHPGGNVSDIKFEYKNTLTTNINSVGELEIESILGKIKESNPITSQSNNIQIENKFQSHYKFNLITNIIKISIKKQKESHV